MSETQVHHNCLASFYFGSSLATGVHFLGFPLWIFLHFPFLRGFYFIFKAVTCKNFLYVFLSHVDSFFFF